MRKATKLYCPLVSQKKKKYCPFKSLRLFISMI